MKINVSEFEAKFGLLQAFDCVDGMHIAVLCPTEHGRDCFCYEQFFNLCTGFFKWKRTFTSVECRWPGSVHEWL